MLAKLFAIQNGQNTSQYFSITPVMYYSTVRGNNIHSTELIPNSFPKVPYKGICHSKNNNERDSYSDPKTTDFIQSKRM